MPAKLLEIIDNRLEQEHWIEEEVLRIGSAPTCDIQVRHGQVPPHSATLEFLDGRYVVYNRNAYPLPIGDRNVPPEGMAPWPPGELLAIDDEVVFQLQVEGDPAPAPRPRPRVEEPPDSDDVLAGTVLPEAEPAAGAGGSRAGVQIVVILVSLAALVALLMYDPQSSSTPGAGVPSFEALMRALTPERVREDPELGAIRSALQEAHIAERRGDFDVARASYAAIRDLLERRGDLRTADEDESPESEPRLEGRIWRYVRARF